MKYVEYLNSLIKEIVAKPDHPVLFGQNINAGSCLGGLTRGLVVNEKGKIWNSTNAENSLVGFGFGIMLGGGQAAFFMKQMDFLLLGIDHLVNTNNIIRHMKHQHSGGSFSIVSVIVDSGYEGPQSSWNNFSDICSIARIPGFSITNKIDASFLLQKNLMQPGFRILGVSQRLEKLELLDPGDAHQIYQDGSIFQYGDGDAATIVSFNFSFPYGWRIASELKAKNSSGSLFNVNAATPVDWSPVIKNLKKTKKLIIIDDSKGANLPCFPLIAEARKEVSLDVDMLIQREIGENWLAPGSDEMNIDYDAIINELLK